MESTRGILRPGEGLTHFALDRAAPPPDLAPFVDRLWTVRWDLPAGVRFPQEILPFPCVNVACEDRRVARGPVDEVGRAPPPAPPGRRFFVHGPGTRRFVALLEGRGWVAGARFRPASFSLFTAAPMRTLLDRILPAEEVMRVPPPAVPADPVAAREALIAWLRAHLPIPHSEEVERANRLVERAQADRALSTAEALARAAGISVRSLHRLLERRLGVSSKWIVRRARVQDAADRVARGEVVDWAAVAAELGYHDQAHLIRDFKAQIGFTPAAYARRCAAARADPSPK